MKESLSNADTVNRCADAVGCVHVWFMQFMLFHQTNPSQNVLHQDLSFPVTFKTVLK